MSKCIIQLPDMSKKEMYRTLVAFALLVVLGFFESSSVPWGLGYSSIIPLFIMYALIAISVGSFKSDSIKMSVMNGLYISILIYTIVFSWLFAVGFFRGSMYAGVIRFISGILAVIITSVATEKISEIMKIN